MSRMRAQPCRRLVGGIGGAGSKVLGLYIALVLPSILWCSSRSCHDESCIDNFVWSCRMAIGPPSTLVFNGPGGVDSVVVPTRGGAMSSRFNVTDVHRWKAVEVPGINGDSGGIAGEEDAARDAVGAEDQEAEDDNAG